MNEIDFKKEVVAYMANLEKEDPGAAKICRNCFKKYTSKGKDYDFLYFALDVLNNRPWYKYYNLVMSKGFEEEVDAFVESYHNQLKIAREKKAYKDQRQKEICEGIERQILAWENLPKKIVLRKTETVGVLSLPNPKIKPWTEEEKRARLAAIADMPEDIPFYR